MDSCFGLFLPHQNRTEDIRDLTQRGREREQRQLRKITFLVRFLLFYAGHKGFVSLP